MAYSDVLVKYTYVGDFNYDQPINRSDYTLIDNEFNTLGRKPGGHHRKPGKDIIDESGTIIMLRCNRVGW